MLTLKTKENRLEFGPGGTIEGVAGWQLQEHPQSVRLFLMWYTMGKGDEDASVVDEVQFDIGGSSHEEPFSFKIPVSPYSFEGKLISLQWTIELVTRKPNDVIRLDIMVSPWVKQLVLDKGDEEEDIILDDGDVLETR